MIEKDDLPELPEWVPLEEYGVGIPASFLISGVLVLYSALSGVLGWGSLTVYGHLGVVVIISTGAVLLAAAGYTYAMIDKTWWLLTEEEDAQSPINFDESEE